INEQFMYEKNNLQGPYKEYYKDATLKTECTYENDKLQGPYKEYHEDGQLKLDCTYNDDKLHGSYKEYGENGKLTKECTYNKEKFQIQKEISKIKNLHTVRRYRKEIVTSLLRELETNAQTHILYTWRRHVYNAHLTGSLIILILIFCLILAKECIEQNTDIESI